MKFISEKAASKAIPSKAIEYIMNPEKCCKDENDCFFIRTIGLDDDRNYSEQFRETAELAGNSYTKHDRKYYHFKYTVSPADYDPDAGVFNILPEQLLDEAETLALDKFSGYQCVIAIQYHGNGLKSDRKNQKHLHAHIVVNASSFIPGQKKVRLSPRDIDSLRDYAFSAGMKYNLKENYWREEVKEKRDKRCKNHTNSINISEGEETLIRKYGKHFSDYSWKEQYRIAIDEARSETTTLEFFIVYLLEYFRIKTKILEDGEVLFRMPYRRTYTSGSQSLGKNYGLNPIRESLLNTKKKSDKYSLQGTRTNWKLQKQMDSIRVARELGASTPAEMELLVIQEGREYGEVKKSFLRAEREYKKLLKAGANEELVTAEQKYQEMEIRYNEAKNRFRRYVCALDIVRENNISSILYETEASSKKVETFDSVESKQEAEKERLKQWKDLRNWSDEASHKVSQKITNDSEEDLRKWAVEMEKYGCKIRITSNTISIQHPNAKQPVRSNRLGGNYERNEIINGIQIQRQRNRGTALCTESSFRQCTRVQQCSGNDSVREATDRGR